MTRYFIDSLCERWIPCQAVTSDLCFIHYRPETVHCSKKDTYNSETIFLALYPGFMQTITSMNSSYKKVNMDTFYFTGSICRKQILTDLSF